MKTATRFTASLGVLLVALLSLSTQSPADTLQLTGVGGTSAAGVYTGIYSLTDNGKPMLAFCDDFDTETYIGESWTANAYSVEDLVDLKFATDAGALSSNSLKDYQAAIYLGQLLMNTPSSDPQQIDDLSFAIWGIFSPSARASAGYDTAALAFDDAALGRNYGPNQYGSWVIWTPDPANSSQEFVVPSAPEPTSLLLFGSGLLGLAVFVRRRQKLAHR
jgi:PEP-CTERM motif